MSARPPPPSFAGERPQPTGGETMPAHPAPNKRRVCLHSGVVDPAHVKARVAEDATYVLRGSTDHFRVSFDESLGQNGQMLADAVLATCERDYKCLQDLFGGIQLGGLPFDILLGPGFEGASHEGCDGTQITCGVFLGTDADL